MEDCLPHGRLPFMILKSLKPSLVICPLRWHFPVSLASSKGLRAMPQGSHSALHQGQMGEECPQLSSPLSTADHVQGNLDLSLDCYGQVYMEPLDGEGERPVSLVSTLSSGSSRDSHSLFGSTAALPSSTTPPIPSEEDIDLELSPAEGTREQAGNRSPTLTGSRERWRQPLDPRVISNQWNNNNATANRRASVGIPYSPTSPVVSETMAPNPKLTYMDRVVMEIIETERMYVKDLRSIVEDYLAHIIDMSNLPIRPEQVCALFGNIEDIYEFNSELLQSLDMCESDPVAIAQCFVNKSEYFEIYTQYCNNYPNSVAALTECMRSKTLAKFFRDRQAALKRSLPLGSYLLKPVQRILKYHLLLQEIAKHFDPDEEGCEVIQDAIDTMTGVAWYINDMKRKHEHAVRVQEIQSLLINWKGPDLTTYGELVLEGTFHVLRAKNTRTLFLFQKMLLITKKRGEHYVYKIHILCSTLMLLDSAKDPLLFSVIHFKRPKQPHTVQAKSVEEKRLWAHHIKRLILENHNTILPQKTKDITVDNSNYPAKHQYSPERLMKAECQADDFHRGRNGRRRSEPVKHITSTRAVLKHADSEGALLGNRGSLPPATSVGALTSSLGEPQAERPCVDELIPQSPTDSNPTLGASPSQGKLEEEEEKEEEGGESYTEDVLMGDDQVADFASSVLAAISCWHSKARALLSTHFTTEDQNGDASDLQTSPVEEMDICRQEQNNEDVKETLSSEVSVQELRPLNGVPPAEESSQLERGYSQSPESPVAPSQPETDIPEPVGTSGETGESSEGGSDSSGLQVEETSVLTNGELSEEEEEVASYNKSILPPSVLDQASVIAEHFSSLSRRSSLVSEDLGSLACPSTPLDNDELQSPSARMDLEKQIELMAKSSPEPPASPDANPSVPVDVFELSEGEPRSTLSKQDRLLIRKIRRYYEHAEHQDANFGIKRRESLSYIPAGLVRHLSQQLNSIPQEEAVPAQRKALSRDRPTSWSVFDLPGLGRSQKPEPQTPFEAKVRSQSVTVSTAEEEEEFRPSSDMLKIWQVMEIEEDSGEVQQTAEKTDNDGRLEVVQHIASEPSNVKTDEQPPHTFEEPETNPASETSSVSSPTTSSPAAEGAPVWDSKPPRPPTLQENANVHPSHLPRGISFRTSMEEDQILQDMGKMKNKVFQLARQYSQRIKNNRPLVWQRSRQTGAQEELKNMPDVREEKIKKRGKLTRRFPINGCDQAVIHEVRSPSPVQTPPCSAGSSQGTVGSPQTETFHWPDVQELRSKYAETRRSAKVNCVCKAPNELQESCSSCSQCPKAPPDCCRSQSVPIHRETAGEDWPQHQTHSLLCRWNSLDHMLGSLPLHEVQNLQEPMWACVAVGKLQEEDGLPQEDPSSLKSAASSSGKSSDSNHVKSLRQKFQGFNTS
ncbi:pleckstrin homology domain-containing family G member 3 [Cololabis saira]|uniref:pleckstrin homology domain-containing family G member 3 n=1 Tax=Cololabis saira TaxID=129043 RepID=UPI002AD3B270|nr:pleckstrin homology domain-containing family G member 3 [Cololabis saira]